MEMCMSAGRSCKPLKVRRRQALAAAGAEEQESAEEAYQRRLRESQRVEERVNVIFSEAEFREELEKACCPHPPHAKFFPWTSNFTCVPSVKRTMSSSSESHNAAGWA